MAVSSKAVVLSINMPPGYLMPRIVDQLMKKYRTDIAQAVVDNPAQLLARAGSPDVVAIVAPFKDSHMLDDVVRQGTADCWEISGSGSGRKLTLLFERKE